MKMTTCGINAANQQLGPEECRIGSLLQSFTRVLGSRTHSRTSNQLIKHLQSALHACEADDDDMPATKHIRLDLPHPLQLLRSMQQQQQKLPNKLSTKKSNRLQQPYKQQLLQGQMRLLQLHMQATSTARLAQSEGASVVSSRTTAPASFVAAAVPNNMKGMPAATEVAHAAQIFSNSTDGSTATPTLQPLQNTIASIPTTAAAAATTLQAQCPTIAPVPTNSSNLLRRKLSVLRKKAKQNRLRGSSFAAIAASSAITTGTSPAVHNAISSVTGNVPESHPTPVAAAAAAHVQASKPEFAASDPFIVAAAATAATTSNEMKCTEQQQSNHQQQLSLSYMQLCGDEQGTAPYLGAASAAIPAATPAAEANTTLSATPSSLITEFRHATAQREVEAAVTPLVSADCAEPTGGTAKVPPGAGISTAVAVSAIGATTVAAQKEQQRLELQRLVGSKRRLLQQRPSEALAQLRRAVAMYAPHNAASTAGGNTSATAVAVPQLLAIKALAVVDLQCIVRAKLQAAAAAIAAAANRKKGGLCITAEELLQAKQQSRGKTINSGSSIYGQDVLDWHKAEAAEHQKRREAAAAARLSALRNASLPEYLDMLKKAKNGRLQEVLGQTDACLRQLAQKLGVKSRAALEGPGDEPAVAAPAESSSDQVVSSAAVSGSSEDCGVLDSSNAWSRLAAQLPADIASQPQMLQGGELREYQLQGLRWLVGLTEKGFNGILADDMGLGKTVQVIAMVCHCVEVQQCRSPFLIVCPASVVSNWAGELQRWAPDLTVVEYRGSTDTRDHIFRKQVRKKSFDVLLTTYELLMSELDRSRLIKIKWAGIVVDEGHRLKNAGCKLAQQLRGYSSNSRLLLTGTPLQNKLSELWSLLNFLMPDVFNSADDFNSWFGAPLEAIKSAGSVAASAAGSVAEAAMLNQEEYLLVTNRLHAVLRPFMMRRLKESVATELPQKNEVVLRCQLGPYQSALYELVKSKLRAEDGSSGVKGINNTVMELRNICNHPLLSKLHPEYGEELLQDRSDSKLPAVLRLSCKVDMLDQVLVRLAACGHKVLLFCTMTRLLDLLEEYCEWRGWEWCRLDGTTAGQERAEAIERFNNPGSGVFLFMLSLRAGGVGLNLQAADTVIMYDSDWNPQIDLQAQARAHRIGQKRQVLVVRLLAEQSIEEHILKVAEEKCKFANSSITGGFFDGKTSAEERRKYLLSVLSSATPGSSSKDGALLAAAAAETSEASGSLAVQNLRSSNVLTARKLNELIARGPDELKQLQEREERLAGSQAWEQLLRQPKGQAVPVQSAAGGGATESAAASAAPQPWDQPLCRLAVHDECAELIATAREAAAPKPKEDLSLYGRGVKRRALGATGTVAVVAVTAIAAAAMGPSADCRPLQKVPAAATSVRTSGGRSTRGTAGAVATAATGRGGGGGGVAAVANAAAAVDDRPTRATKPAAAAGSHASRFTSTVDGAMASRLTAVHVAAETGHQSSTAVAAAASNARSVSTHTAAAAPLSAAKIQTRVKPSVADPAAAAAFHSKLETSLMRQQHAGTQQQQVAGHAKTHLMKGQLAAHREHMLQQQQQDATVQIEDASSRVPGAVATNQPQLQLDDAPATAAAAMTAAPGKHAGAIICGEELACMPEQLQLPSETAAAKPAAAAATATGMADNGAEVLSPEPTAPASTAAALAAVSKGRVTRATVAQRQLTGKAAAAAPAVVEIGSAALFLGDAGAANGGSSSSSNNGSCIRVCCGSVQGWYWPARDAVQLIQQQLQHAGTQKQRDESVQGQHLWLAKSAFVKLGREGSSGAGNPNRLIRLMDANGQPGSSLESYTKQPKVKQKGQEHAAGDSVTAALQREHPAKATGTWTASAAAAACSPEAAAAAGETTNSKAPTVGRDMACRTQRMADMGRVAAEPMGGAASDGCNAADSQLQVSGRAEPMRVPAAGAAAHTGTDIHAAVGKPAAAAAAANGKRVTRGALGQGQQHTRQGSRYYNSCTDAGVRRIERAAAEQQQAPDETAAAAPAATDGNDGVAVLVGTRSAGTASTAAACDLGTIIRQESSRPSDMNSPRDTARLPAAAAASAGGPWFVGPPSAAMLAGDFAAVPMTVAQQQALLSRRSRSNNAWRVMHRPGWGMPQGYVAVEVRMGKVQLPIYYAPDGKMLRCKRELLAHAGAHKQQQLLLIKPETVAAAPVAPAAASAACPAGTNTAEATVVGLLPELSTKDLQPGSSRKDGMAGARKATSSNSNDNKNGCGRVLVKCGTVSGWYCPERDEVLIEQQQQPPQWLTKSGFMKLGGEGHKHDASKAIKLVAAGDQQGCTLATYFTKYKQKKLAAVSDSLATLAAAAAAVEATPGSGSSDAAAGVENEAPSALAAADSLMSLLASPPPAVGAIDSELAVNEAQNVLSAAAGIASRVKAAGISRKKRQNASAFDNCTAGCLQDNKRSKVAAEGSSSTVNSVVVVDSVAVFDAVWSQGQQLQAGVADVPVLHVSGDERALPQILGSSLAAMFEQLWQISAIAF